MKTIRLQDVVLGPVPAGKQAGQATLSRLVAKTPPPGTGPEVLLVDCRGIDVATASFLRESLLAFRDLLRGQRSNYYPVLANVSASIQEELSEVIRARGGALMCCTLDSDGRASNPTVIGELEPKQRMTFDLVTTRGETDAVELTRIEGDGVHSTAWNNRLAGLAALGLVMEIARGRTKKYRPLFA